MSVCHFTIAVFGQTSILSPPSATTDSLGPPIVSVWGSTVISPLLANVYLHYVFDLWAERW
jgi:hypothetical protein